MDLHAFGHKVRDSAEPDVSAALHRNDPDQPPVRRRPLLCGAVGALAAVALLIWGIVDVWPFFADDAYISLRYADRLLAGAGLTWTDGERAEGYSNLLWLLLCAAAGGAGLPLPLAARVLGVSCVVASLLAIAWRFRRSPASAAAPLLAATVAVPPWTIGGLEMPLVLLCNTLALLGLERAVSADAPRRIGWISGGWFAAATLTRPDAPLLPAVAAIVLVLAPAAAAQRWRLPIAIVTPTIVAWLGQTVFRIVHHGDWLANTARVKLAIGVWSPRDGLGHLAELAAAMPWLAALAALAAIWPRPHGAARTIALTLTAMVFAWAGYLVAIGGDFFPAFRFAMPILPLLGLLVGMLFERLAGVDRRCWLLTLTVAGVAVASTRIGTINSPQTARAAGERWEGDMLAAGDTLAQAFANERPLVAVDAAGALPFASRLPSLDMLGLCDQAIARDVTRAPAGNAYERAHRRARPDELLRREPDLFVFGGELPHDANGLQLVDDARFVLAYRCAWLVVRDDLGARSTTGERLLPIWLRLHGRVGLRVHDDHIDVPAYFVGGWQMQPGMRKTPPTDPVALAAWQQTAALMRPWLLHGVVLAVDAQGPCLQVRRPGEYSLHGLQVPAGEWRLTAEPVIAGLHWTLRDADGEPLPERDEYSRVDTGPVPCVLTLVVAAEAVGAHVRSVRLQRRR